MNDNYASMDTRLEDVEEALGLLGAVVAMNLAAYTVNCIVVIRSAATRCCQRGNSEMEWSGLGNGSQR